MEDRKFLQKLSLECLVLDEGHMLKNMATQRYNYLMKIKVSHKINISYPVSYHLEKGPITHCAITILYMYIVTLIRLRGVCY